MSRSINALVAACRRDVASAPFVGGVGCGCGQEMRYEVLTHLLDCEDPIAAGLTDDDGNYVWRGCARCYTSWCDDLQRTFRLLRSFLPVSCFGCGKPISQLSDIMLRVRQL
jgi:hypothetical protein